MAYRVVIGQVTRCALVSRSSGTLVVFSLKEFPQEFFEIPCTQADGALMQVGDLVRVRLFDAAAFDLLEERHTQYGNQERKLTTHRGSSVDNLTLAGLA